VELRNRRRDRSGVGGGRAGLYLLTGRRSHISTATARRPLPANKTGAGNPQLPSDTNELTPGTAEGVLMTSVNRSEDSRMSASAPIVLKRAVALTSDAILLTLASPFFAAWWLARRIRRRL
jgi:hypothetical protein